MKYYFFALMELDDEKVKEEQGKHILSAMQELKTSCTPNGKVTFYQVEKESEYKRVEREMREHL